MVIDLKTEILRERNARQAMEHSLEGAGNRSARQDEAERRIQAHIHAADDRIGARFDQVGERDVNTVRGRAVDDPRRAAESAIGHFRPHGARARLGGADPALLAQRRDD